MVPLLDVIAAASLIIATLLILVAVLLSRCIDTRQQEHAGTPPQDGSNQPRSVVANARSHPGIGGSIIGALVLLAWDAGLFGSYILSMLFCPIWFLVSILKNSIQRPGWTIALARIAIPPLTLALVLANNALQWRIADANAAQVVTACEEFHAVTGTFPKTLDELVPRYQPSVLRAKYCLDFGEFRYWNNEGHAMLVWYAVPPFGRRVYNFRERRWGYLD
jgi:hypothetical protein